MQMYDETQKSSVHIIHMLICWHLKEVFNADVIGGCLACIMSFSMGISTYILKIIKVHVIYHVLNVLTCYFSFKLKL